MKLVTNHRGWSPRGILSWLRAWAWPVQVWGVEITRQLVADGFLCDEGGCPLRVYQRRVKVGPLCFAFGKYSERQAP